MRSTKLEVMNRVEETLEVILHGGRFRNLCDYASKKEWGVSRSQLRRYQAKAMEICHRQMEKDRDKIFAVHRMRREVIYARAMEANDLATACRVLADDAALMGFYEVKVPKLDELMGRLAAVEGDSEKQ